MHAAPGVTVFSYGGGRFDTQLRSFSGRTVVLKSIRLSSVSQKNFQRVSNLNVSWCVYDRETKFVHLKYKKLFEYGIKCFSSKSY